MNSFDGLRMMYTKMYVFLSVLTDWFYVLFFFISLALSQIGQLKGGTMHFFGFGVEFNDFFQDMHVNVQTNFLFQHSKQHMISMNMAARYSFNKKRFDCDTNLKYRYDILNRTLDESYLTSFFSINYNLQKDLLQVKTWFENPNDDLTLKNLLLLNFLYLGKRIDTNMHDRSYTWSFMTNGGLASQEEFEDAAQRQDFNAFAVNDIKSAIAAFLVISFNDEVLMREQWDKVVKRYNARRGII